MYRVNTWGGQIDFNSTMVRLKENANYQVINRITFQFHYGTIKRSISFFLLHFFSYFNSTMVRLKVKAMKEKGIKDEQISIPLWYD